jgi:predicted secreted hydrolase
MDHEWFTNQLAPGQVGWDWFSVQLEDNTEFMLFRLRRADGGVDPYSSGTFVDAAGKARHLSAGEFTLAPLAYWRSPKTGARYPIRWRIAVPGKTFECDAALPDQELAGEGLTYWEGAVIYSGGARGTGYLEMTGYDKPVRMD